MAEIPFEADHSVVRAEIDTREILGISFNSVISSAKAFRMGDGMIPWRDSVSVGRSVVSTSPITAMRRDRKGTADIMTKKDACAA